ncbi:hypothetical protein N7501_009914 [Penicillium viridicatum]|nr:hypothetical protein N7501_009914 [Penicillium viridicatum]
MQQYQPGSSSASVSPIRLYTSFLVVDRIGYRYTLLKLVYIISNQVEVSLSMDHVRRTVIVSLHEETEYGYRSGYLPGCIDILTKWARYKPLQ